MRAAKSNGRATMASRYEDIDSLDYFPSAPWMGRSVGEVIIRLGLPLGSLAEDPAMGEGHLLHGMADVWPRVQGFDVWPHKARGGLPDPVQRDYLCAFAESGPLPDWTVMNPPFGDKTAPFIRKACARSRIGVAALLQLRLMEGPGRYALFHACGLYATAVVPRKRAGLRKGVWVPNQSTATAYAWFIFVRPDVVSGWAGFTGEARQVWIDPEAGDRLTHESDMVFAGLRPAVAA